MDFQRLVNFPFCGWGIGQIKIELRTFRLAQSSPTLLSSSPELSAALKVLMPLLLLLLLWAGAVTLD